MSERVGGVAPAEGEAGLELSYGDEADEGVASGLAAERTEMAWSRSGLAMIGCGAIIAKGLPALSWSTTEHTLLLPQSASHPVLGGSVLVMGVTVWLLGLYSARRRRHAGGRHVAVWADLAPTAYGTAGVGVAALLLSAFVTG